MTGAPSVVPQRDVGAGYRPHRQEIDAAIARVLDRGQLVLGPEVSSFEDEFAAYIGVAHGIGVASGTDAIGLALTAHGVGRGDAVLTVSHTAVATVAGVEMSGATPIFVDVDRRTCCMSPDALEAAIAWARREEAQIGPVRAVVVVNLYGRPAPLDELAEVAHAAALVLIEDCAQSHGARLRGKSTGACGDAAAFSFYPTKNLPALGDGGMVVTDDPKVAERVRLLRQYGWRERFVSEIAGTNSRLDELQAAVLRVRLPHLDGENQARRSIAAAYDAAFATTGLDLPDNSETVDAVYHQYVVRSAARDQLRSHLERRGVTTAVHYPVPVHLQPAYRHHPRAEPLSRTEQAAAQVLSLPIYPEMDADLVDHVVGAVREWREPGDVHDR